MRMIIGGSRWKGNQGCVTHAFQSLSALHIIIQTIICEAFVYKVLCEMFVYIHPSLAYNSHSTRVHAQSYAEGSKSVDCTTTICVRRCGKTFPHSGKPAICRWLCQLGPTSSQVPWSNLQCQLGTMTRSCIQRQFIARPVGFIYTRPLPAFGRRAQNGSSGSDQSGSCKNITPRFAPAALSSEGNKNLVTNREKDSFNY